jgi:GT2 family glycosyltransferase
MKTYDRCLSVIIITNNGADTLGEQLEALLAQDYSGEWEVVVVDNCSTDATPLLVRAFQQRMPQLKLVQARAKRLIPYARNVGVEAARGDRLLFCDSDDVVDAGWLAAMERALDTHELVAGRIDYTRLNPPWLQRTRTGPQQHGLQAYEYPPFLPHAASCNLGLRRAVYERTGPFDETFSNLSDTDFCWRAQLGGTELTFAPEALVHYRLRPSFKTTFKQGQRYAEYNVLLYKKYRTHGMPPIGWKDSVRSWLQLVRTLPTTADRGKLGAWLWKLAWLSGRLRGSIKHRVFAL